MRLERVLAAIHDSTDCMEITCDDREFEFALGELFKRMGYSVEVTKATGDGGIDLNVHKRTWFWFRRRRHYIVQAKHWQSGVGEPAIRDLYAKQRRSLFQQSLNHQRLRQQRFCLS